MPPSAREAARRRCRRPADTPTAPSSPAATGPGGPARQHDGRQPDLPVPHGRQQPRAVLHARVLGGGPYPINFFQMNPYAAGNVVARAHRRSAVALSVAADSVPPALSRRAEPDRQLHVQHRQHRPLCRLGDERRGLLHAARQEPQLGPGCLRRAQCVLTAYSTYELPFGRDRRYRDPERACSIRSSADGPSRACCACRSGRPFLLTSERWTVNQQDSGVILNGITVDELQKMIKVSPGPSGNVYVFDPKLIGADGRANPQYLSVPTTPGERGQYVHHLRTRTLRSRFLAGQAVPHHRPRDRATSRR